MLVSTIVLLLASVFSSIIAGFIPRFSINYISILVGIILGLIIPLNELVAPFKSEAFMYIVAPLIYFEGQTTRMNLVGKKFWQIIQTAIVLVLVATIFTGFAVSLLGVQLALAFFNGGIKYTDRCNGDRICFRRINCPRRTREYLKSWVAI